MRGPWAISNDPRLDERHGDECEAENERWSDDQWRLADDDARYAQGGSAEEIGP